MKLPSEEELRNHIRSEMASDLELACRILEAGVSLLSQNLSLDTDNPPTYDELWLSLGVVVKGCKQYRAVGALVELGLGDVAMTNCRMLIETSLAAMFLMMPEVHLKRGGKPLPEVPDYPLTTAFRTQLYVANDALTQEKILRMMHEQGSLTGPDVQGMLERAEKFADEITTPIGTEWKKRLKESKSFSGLKILDLADSFGRRDDYAIFYRPASSGIHGADARKSMRLDQDEDGHIAFEFPNTGEGAATALKLGSHAILDVLQVVSLRYGLGLEDRTHELRTHVQMMKDG